MPSTKSHIKVSAAEALEFEAKGPAPALPSQTGWGVRVLLITGIIAIIATAWYFSGDKLIAMIGGAESSIPVIYAKEGPIKVRPKNPGGLKVPDRDKLVYGRLTGEQSEVQFERLLPGPEQPLPRPKGSQSSGNSGGYTQGNVALMPGVPSREPESLLTVPSEINKSPASVELKAANPVVLKPVDVVPTAKQVANAKRPGPSPEMPTSPAVKAVTSLAAAKAKSTAPVQLAPIASAKPVQLAARTPTGVSPKKTATKVASSGALIYRVQLAAARTPEKARAEWARLRTKHADILGKLRLTVMKVDLGPKKGTYYRVRGGPFSNEATARNVCKSLSKRKVACLLVKPK